MFAKEVCGVSSLLEIAFVFLSLLIHLLLLHLSQIAFLPLEAFILVTVEHLLASWLWGLRSGSSSLRLQQIGILRFYIIGMHYLLLRLSHVTFFLLLMCIVFFTSIHQSNVVIRFLLLLVVVQNFAIFNITWSWWCLLTPLSIEELRVHIRLSWELVCLQLLPLIEELWSEHLDLLWTRVVRAHLIIHFLSGHEYHRLLDIFDSLTDTLIFSFFLRHVWNGWIGLWTCSSELILPILMKKRSSCLMTLHDRESVHWRGFLIERARVLMLLHLLPFILAKA